MPADGTSAAAKKQDFGTTRGQLADCLNVRAHRIHSRRGGRKGCTADSLQPNNRPDVASWHEGGPASRCVLSPLIEADQTYRSVPESPDRTLTWAFRT
jgi:hypothetical protein